MLVTAAALITALLTDRIPQDPGYHHFADQRALLGVANFWNVFSNAGFLLAGLLGLGWLRRVQAPELRPAYVTFCVAVTLVAFGSSWYHYSPSSESLLWDRLPMAPGFMALFALVLGERISWRLGQRLLWPLVVAGIASVLYWSWTENRGIGDLRPYALVQFLPIVLMPLLLLLFPGNAASARWLWWTFAGYGLAKVAEHFDVAIHDALGISGHSLKHIASSVAALFAVLAMLAMKAPSTSGPGPTKARSEPWRSADRGRRR